LPRPYDSLGQLDLGVAPQLWQAPDVEPFRLSVRAELLDGDARGELGPSFAAKAHPATMSIGHRDQRGQTAITALAGKGVLVGLAGPLV
jgi:hypothetical protein